MSKEILQMCVMVFATQLVFIFCRTWNVKAIAKNSVSQVLVSGAIVHLSWLVSIAIGAVSMSEVISSGDPKHIPVIICSMAGGLIGSYFGMLEKRKKKNP